MILFSSFQVFKFALQNFFRNFWLSVATLTVIIIMLFFVNIIVGINYIKTTMLTAVQQQIDVSLDFKNSITETDILKIKDHYDADKRVENTTIITPEMNLDQFKKKYPEIGDKVIPVLDSNPLGYTLKIRLYSLDDYTSILKELEANDEYTAKLDRANFNDYRMFTSQAASFSDKVNTAAVALATIFFIIALIIIFNTIRVSVYTHRDEIAIMKLVGATNTFIRMPFLIESLLYSTISVGITLGLVFVSARLIQPLLSQFMSDITALDLNAYFSSHLIEIFSLQLIVVAALTMFSTSIALRRYLRA